MVPVPTSGQVEGQPGTTTIDTGVPLTAEERKAMYEKAFQGLNATERLRFVKRKLPNYMAIERKGRTVVVNLDDVLERVLKAQATKADEKVLKESLKGLGISGLEEKTLKELLNCSSKTCIGKVLKGAGAKFAKTALKEGDEKVAKVLIGRVMRDAGINEREVSKVVSDSNIVKNIKSFLLAPNRQSEQSSILDLLKEDKFVKAMQEENPRAKYHNDWLKVKPNKEKILGDMKKDPTLTEVGKDIKNGKWDKLKNRFKELPKNVKNKAVEAIKNPKEAAKGAKGKLKLLLGGAAVIGGLWWFLSSRRKKESGYIPQPPQPSPHPTPIIDEEEWKLLERPSLKGILSSLNKVTLNYPGKSGVWRGANWIGGKRGLQQGTDVARTKIVMKSFAIWLKKNKAKLKAKGVSDEEIESYISVAMSLDPFNDTVTSAYGRAVKGLQSLINAYLSATGTSINVGGSTLSQIRVDGGFGLETFTGLSTLLEGLGA